MYGNHWQSFEMCGSHGHTFQSSKRHISQKWPNAIFLKNDCWQCFSKMANGHISLDLQRLGRKTAKSLQTRTTYLLARFSSSHDDNIKTTKWNQRRQSNRKMDRDESYTIWERTVVRISGWNGLYMYLKICLTKYCRKCTGSSNRWQMGQVVDEQRHRLWCRIAPQKMM